MTAPLMTLTPASSGLLGAGLVRTDADANTQSAGGNAAAKASNEFTTALNMALLLGHGPAAALRASTPVNPTGAPDAPSNEDAATATNGNASGQVGANTTPVDARAGERRQSQDQDRTAINAMRSFVERIAGVSAEKNPVADAVLAAPAAASPPTNDTADKKTEGSQPAERSDSVVASTSVAPVHIEPTVDPSIVVRDMSALQPELRVRIERVITRMEEEFGHEVTVAETWRSQTRQDYLHEQGRTQPGAIVTWTQHSKHTDGMAADLVVDGDQGDDVAYGRLQRIAAEEGLRTLGARDPGHVELRASRSSMQAAQTKLLATAANVPSIANAIARATASAPSPSPEQQPRSAPAPQAPAPENGDIARIATVASVAQIAPVAAVASVTSGSSSEPAADDAAPSVHARTKAPAPKREIASGVQDSSPMRISAVPRDGTAAPRAREAATAMTFTPGVETASRAERVHALQDAARSGSVSGLVLRLDSPDGTDDRVRVDLRGRQVSARIDVPDATRATDLTNKLPELARALEARGFDSPDLQIHAALASRADEKLFALAGTSGESLSPRSTQDIIGTRGDSRPAPDDGAPPRSHQHHHNRHRSRKEREGDTQ